jgi:hypothetical protein
MPETGIISGTLSGTESHSRCPLEELPSELGELPPFPPVSPFGKSLPELFLPNDPPPRRQPGQPVVSIEAPFLAQCTDPHQSGLTVIQIVLWAFWLSTLDPTVMPDPDELKDFLAWLDSPESRIEWLDPVRGLICSDALLPVTLTDALQTIINKTFAEQDAKFMHRFFSLPGQFAGDLRERLLNDFYTFFFEHVLVPCHVDHLTDHSLGCLCRCICTIAAQSYCIDQVPRDLVTAFCIHSQNTEMLGAVVRYWVSGAPVGF